MGSKPKLDYGRIRRLWDMGLPADVIAKEVGTSLTYLRFLVPKLGLTGYRERSRQRRHSEDYLVKARLVYAERERKRWASRVTKLEQVAMGRATTRKKSH